MYEISLLAVILLVASSSLFLLQQIIYYLGNMRVKKQDSKLKGGLGNIPLISVVVPVRNEPIEILEELLYGINKLRYPKEKIELLIISDDKPPYSNEVKKKVTKLANELKLNANVYIRENPLGSKAGALAYGVLKTKSNYVLIIDVDSRLSDNILFEGVKCLNEGYDACVYRWLPYLFFPTKVACAVSKSMYYVVDSLYKGREAWNFFVFPLGSGTLFRKNSLMKVNLWDFDIIQDDMWIGVKFMHKGLKIKYLDHVGVRVSVPSTYASIRTQQLRWAYGVAQVLRKGLKLIIKGKVSLIKRIEAIFFLSQYVPTIFMTLGQVLLFASLVFEKIDPMFKFFYLNFISMGITSFYITQFLKSLKKRGYTLYNALKSLGTNAAVVTTMIPALAVSTIKGFLNIKETYRKTPKGVQELLHKNLSPYEVCYLTFATIALIYALTHNFTFSAGFFALITLAILYTLIRSGIKVKKCVLLQ